MWALCSELPSNLRTMLKRDYTSKLHYCWDQQYFFKAPEGYRRGYVHIKQGVGGPGGVDPDQDPRQKPYTDPTHEKPVSDLTKFQSNTKYIMILVLCYIFIQWILRVKNYLRGIECSDRVQFRIRQLFKIQIGVNFLHFLILIRIPIFSKYGSLSDVYYLNPQC